MQRSYKKALQFVSENFFFSSAALTLLAGAVLIFLIQAQIESYVLQGYGRSMAHAMETAVYRQISPLELESSFSKKKREEFRELVSGYFPVRSVKGVKVWNARGDMVYAEPRGGGGFETPRGGTLQQVLGGQVKAEFAPPLEARDVLGDSETKGRLIKVYAPIKNKGVVVGVYGVYVSSAPVMNRISYFRSIVIAGFLLFYLIFMGIAKIGELALRRERARLEQIDASRQDESLDDTVLTGRERQVLRLMASNLSNKEIAKELSISNFTVAVHCRSIYSKLEVNNRYDAIHLAVKAGMLE